MTAYAQALGEAGLDDKEAYRWQQLANIDPDLWNRILLALDAHELSVKYVLKQAETDGLYSSERGDWATPHELFDLLDEEFDFTLDVCATPWSAKCPRYFTPEQDAFQQVWDGRCFMNPPYGRTIGEWIQKAWDSAEREAEVVVCLVPARVDTDWWWEYCRHGEVRFLKGRLHFDDGEDAAPFPSAVVVFGREFQPSVVWWEAWRA